MSVWLTDNEKWWTDNRNDNRKRTEINSIRFQSEEEQEIAFWESKVEKETVEFEDENGEVFEIPTKNLSLYKDEIPQKLIPQTAVFDGRKRVLIG